MSILKNLAIIFAVVLTAVLIDSGFLYHQASTGKKLPFKLGLFPRIGGDLQ
jgi:hypothetical protein